MTYQETLDFIYSQVPMFQNLGAGAYKPGLDTTLRLCEHWGNPHLSLNRCIHIAGTNGKGSTAHTTAAILQSAGYRTALYTSPHLLDFRERIRVDGKPVSKEFVVDFVAEFLRTPELVALHPTFFELSTVMAFRYFADCNVDVAVIEVGLGGRLDCTNIITPLASVITNISLDHKALLGNTEPEIAREKAGIIKSGIPAIVGHATGEVRRVFEDKASAVHAPIVFAEDSPAFAEAVFEEGCIRYNGTAFGDFRGELCGECQKENTNTILHVLETVRPYFPKIDAEAVSKGFAEVCELTGLMGRWMQRTLGDVRVICDTGHNIGGWEHLGPSLSDMAECGELHMVLGFVNDKDIDAIVNCFPRNAKYYFCTPSVNRGRAAEETAAIAAGHGISGTAYETVREACEAAVKAAHPGATVFVGGSTFVVADYLAISQ